MSSSPGTASSFAAPEPVPPAPTVREAMTIGPLADARLMAGRAGIDRRVAWVRVMETPESVNLVRTGDLFLTAAFAIKDDPRAQSQLVGKLAAAGGAGLVVKPEPYLRGLDDMAAEADRHSLPLFTVAPEVSWADLMAPLLERIINAEHARLKLSMDIHHRFTELVLDGKGVDEICRTLADLLDSAVSVEDASFHLLAHAGGSGGDAHRRETIARHGTPQRVLFDPGIQRVLRQVETRRGPMKVPAFPHLGMARERIIAPITAANQVLGYISVLEHPPHNEELAFMAVEQAAIIMALALTKERELAELESRVRGEFLEDLIQGTYGDANAAQRRARQLGYPLTGRHVLLVADIDDFTGFLRSRQLTEVAIQGVKREYLRRISGLVKADHPRALIEGRSDMIVSLLPLGPDGSWARVRPLADRIRESVAEWRPGFTVSVVHSAPVAAPDGIEAAFKEVRAVHDALARFQRWDQVVAVPELGLTGLLASVQDDRLLDFARRHLGPLADHDRARGSQLLPTLRAYLETGEQQSAARRLGIHPNTLRYRLERIREIGGMDLEDPEARLNLAVALRVHGLLGL
jgi:purine catabolism regulator